ncbi:MAG: hypothetical protein RML12_06580 [Xanthomonadales bacterium]|nr:hypothetical protein [Xanthomonadales bacterium]
MLASRELPVVLLAQGLVLWWTGLYRGLWRFASLPDLVNIARACLLGALAVALALFLFNRLEGVPRSVLLLYPAILALLLGGPRLAYRYWKDSRLDLALDAPSKRVLILGAGRAAEALLRELRQDPRYRVVGLLDDDPRLRGAKIHGIPVLGPIETAADDRRRVGGGDAADRDSLGEQSRNAAHRRRLRGDRVAVPHRAAAAGRGRRDGCASSISRRSRSRTCSGGSRSRSTGPPSASDLPGAGSWSPVAAARSARSCAARWRDSDLPPSSCSSTPSTPFTGSSRS